MEADLGIRGWLSNWAVTLLATFLLMVAAGCSNDSNSPTVAAPRPAPINASTSQPTSAPTAKPTGAPSPTPKPSPTASPTPGPLSCDSSTQYPYTFTNYCRYPVWLAQLRTGDSTGFPPVGGNWAVAGACSKNSDCLSGSVCSGGQCTCASSADCAGGSSCTNGLCSNTDVFCMPQNWASGRFWPRTGCTSGPGDTLTCDTGQCGAPGQLDCDTIQKSGNNPATLFEVTSSTGGVVNYDVSVVDGGNATLRATPIDSSTSKGIDCIAGGCTADLKLVCPANLRITIPAVTTPTPISCGGKFCPEGTCVNSACVIGCLAPCDQCKQPSPPAGLSCKTNIGSTYTACDSSIHNAKYEDLYCAKSFFDGNSMQSGNQGTPTCFEAKDCPPGSTCEDIGSIPGAPAEGVCIDPSNPNYSACFQNLTTGACSATTVGQPCGGEMEFFIDALGYKCRAVKYNGGASTAYACLPPTTTGLGACNNTGVSPTAGTCGITNPVPVAPTLYKGTASPANADFVTAAIQAGGGTTPYYAFFKQACRRAYSWTYDDPSGDLSCTAGFSGFDVQICPENAP